MPKSIHDVHRLTSCLAALSRFLSKATEKQLLFFKILKKASNFEWNDEHRLAFEDLKKYLANLPTLSVPKEGETLSLYLTASDESISAVLVREEGRRQLPVYFISRALKGPETRYQPLEKVALALVNAARRLRPHFHAHPIQVLTDLPLRQVLTKPEASGRIAKWAVELGEHTISFIPRQAIKGQALADFLVEARFVEPAKPTEPAKDKSKGEAPKQPPKDCWKVFVDGASGHKGCGAGILLISPEGKELTYALRFNFSTTNNEVEYEALIAGLRLAQTLQIRAIQVHSDSQVIVSHMLGKYEAKGKQMKKYLHKAKTLQQGFSYFELV